jgi:hypothetical protein
VALTQTVKPMQRGLFVAIFGLLGLLMIAAPASAQSGARSPDEVTTRAPRPRVVIQPRRYRLSPNARRECRSRLVQEYRVSGTVIVPQTYCWWE